MTTRTLMSAGIAAVACILALVMTSTALAGQSPGANRDADRRASLDDRLASPTEVIASVRRADGSAATGAVVFTSIGGQGIADDEGVARFTIELPRGVQELHVTAASTERGVNALGSVLVNNPSGAIDAGTITVSGDTDCEPQWAPTFGGDSSGVDGGVFALAVFDDGSGPALYAAGVFFTINGVELNNIAKWDGVLWSPLGSGLDGQTTALTVFDDGSGAALYAGGYFTTAGGVSASGVARWDGLSWSPLGIGMNDAVHALTVFDDGTGPALYAGGDFTTADDVEANRIARWDGSEWSPLRGGMNNTVFALASFDDGSGPALYAGGDFSFVDGFPRSNIAKWNGSFWSSVGGSMSSRVTCFAVYDDGSGPALYAGGYFGFAGGVPAVGVARWNGATWSPLGSGVSTVNSLAVFDDGSGTALYAGGGFSSAGGVPASNIAKWDGVAWSTLGSGIDGNGVSCLAAFDDGTGNGPSLFVGGEFEAAGDIQTSSIAKWRADTAWSPLGDGMNGAVRALTVFDDGAGPALYAGGEFTGIGGVAASHIARWDGVAWSPLGSGLRGPANSVVYALAVFDDGAGDGPALYAGGLFTTAGDADAHNIARWDGEAWSPVGEGTDHFVSALAVFDDGSGPALFAGGSFTLAGGMPASRIARWDGAAWTPLGSGLGGPSPTVRALLEFDDGTGSALYAGGDFTTAGGIAANRVAKWDGVAWSALGSGQNNRVHALAAFDDGSGPALYAGGIFTSGRIAKWDGAAWTPLGSGVNTTVFALGVFDDGSGEGPALYAGGVFTIAGGGPANRIARWDGAAWSSLGDGMTGSLSPNIPAVYSLASFRSGADTALFAGGHFLTTDGAQDSYIAKWQGCDTSSPCPGDTNGDGLVNFADLNQVLAQFGDNVPPGTGGDVTADGVVNFADLNEVLANFGNACN